MVRPGSGRFEVGFWVGFRVGLRARDFPTEGVLSRTPLIIRTVNQSRGNSWRLLAILNLRKIFLFSFGWYIRMATGFQLFTRVGNPIFARLFFSSSRQVGYFKIPWIYRKVGRQVGLENFQYFGQVSLKIIENMNFLVGRQVGWFFLESPLEKVGRQVGVLGSQQRLGYLPL